MTNLLLPFLVILPVMNDDRQARGNRQSEERADDTKERATNDDRQKTKRRREIKRFIIDSGRNDRVLRFLISQVQNKDQKSLRRRNAERNDKAGIAPIVPPTSGKRSTTAAKTASGKAYGIPSAVSPIKRIRPQMTDMIRFPRT